jgi:hypothetical protein
MHLKSLPVQYNFSKIVLVVSNLSTKFEINKNIVYYLLFLQDVYTRIRKLLSFGIFIEIKALSYPYNAFLLLCNCVTKRISFIADDIF